MNKNFKKLIAGALAVSIFVTSSSVATVQAATRITPAEKKEFKRYLTNGMEFEDYAYFSSEKGPILSPNFCLCDVNNDGHKDLIVSGFVGIRGLCLTEIYMHVGKRVKNKVDFGAHFHKGS